MYHILFIALGGCLGAISRYFISKLISQSINNIFPWGTLIINLTGSFLIGFFFDFFDKFLISRNTRSFISIGFLGAYTTFSTYTLESINLFKEGEYKLFFINILLSNILGLGMVIAGIFTSKFIFKRY